MRRHDLELIAALAEGTLEDETEARALVESSEEHRAEYEAQRAAIETLAAVGPARMSPEEKTALHRDVWTQLRSAEGQPERNAPLYYRWAFAAAGLFVVVGLVAVLTQVNELDDSAADLTTEVQREEAAAPPALSGDDDAGNLEPLESLGDGTAAAEGAADPSIAFFSAQASRVRDGELTSDQAVAEEDQKTFSEENVSCVETSGVGDYAAIATIELDEGQVGGLEADVPYLVAIPIGMELTPDTPVAFIDTETCALTYLDE